MLWRVTLVGMSRNNLFLLKFLTSFIQCIEYRALIQLKINRIMTREVTVVHDTWLDYLFFHLNHSLYYVCILIASIIYVSYTATCKVYWVCPFPVSAPSLLSLSLTGPWQDGSIVPLVLALLFKIESVFASYFVLR